jgi:hypothetical protein
MLRVGIICVALGVAGGSSLAAEDQQACTDEMSAQKCFEVGVGNVEKALAEFEASQAELRQQIKLANDKIDSLTKQQAVDIAAQTQAAVKDLSSKMDTLKQTSLKQCKVCFQETEGSDQCQGNRNTCSDWASVEQQNPTWSEVFRDDTDNRPGGCKYQWRLICQ